MHLIPASAGITAHGSLAVNRSAAPHWANEQILNDQTHFSIPDCPAATVSRLGRLRRLDALHGFFVS